MDLKWWWYQQLETSQIFISLWQAEREMPQVKQTVSQMYLQIREGSSGDLLLEEHVEEQLRGIIQSVERWQHLWAARLVCASRLDAGAKRSHASLPWPSVPICTLLSTELKKCGYMTIRSCNTSWPGALSGWVGPGALQQAAECSLLTLEITRTLWSVPVLQMDDHRQFTSSPLALPSTSVKSRQGFSLLVENTW